MIISKSCFIEDMQEFPIAYLRVKLTGGNNV